jgi:hypothetical protein
MKPRAEAASALEIAQTEIGLDEDLLSQVFCGQRIPRKIPAVGDHLSLVSADELLELSCVLANQCLSLTDEVLVRLSRLVHTASSSIDRTSPGLVTCEKSLSARESVRNADWISYYHSSLREL